MKDFYLGLYEKATPADISWAERLNTTKDVGYSFMEISIDESDMRQERLEKRSPSNPGQSPFDRFLDTPNSRLFDSFCLNGLHVFADKQS